MPTPGPTEAAAVHAWLPRAQPCHLGDAEAHLWLVDLDLIPERMTDFASILSEDERDRARRFLKQVDAERYASARASLRCILGSYLQLNPRQLRFAYSNFGKPHLADEGHAAPLHFSVAHSAALALFGVGRSHNIGVDLERMRDDVEVIDLAARFFSPREAEILRSLTGARRLEAFFCGWTRKEAYLKARGHGLSYGLDRVEVALEPGEPVVIIGAQDDPDVSKRWTLQHLSPAPGYIGAAAIEAPNMTFQMFRWTPTQAK